MLIFSVVIPKLDANYAFGAWFTQKANGPLLHVKLASPAQDTTKIQHTEAPALAVEASHPAVPDAAVDAIATSLAGAQVPRLVAMKRAAVFAALDQHPVEQISRGDEIDANQLGARHLHQRGGTGGLGGGCHRARGRRGTGRRGCGTGTSASGDA